MTPGPMPKIVTETIRVKLRSGEVVCVGLLQFVNDDPALWVFRLDGSPYTIGHFNGGGYQRRISRKMIMSTVCDSEEGKP